MFGRNLNFKMFKIRGAISKSMTLSSNTFFMSSFVRTYKKFYFSYPCPRKLREIVKITLFEREQPSRIKDIWKQYYDEKAHAFGTDITSDEMNLIINKYVF
jgi:hypothetical protein